MFYPDSRKSINILVNHFLLDGSWNIHKLRDTLSEHMVQHIITIGIGNKNKKDQVFWDLNTDGKYSNKSSWEMLRTKRPLNQFLAKMWSSNIPFKISFLTWRLWQGKLPFDDFFARFRANTDTNCNCCLVPVVENMFHIFVTGEVAQLIWKHFGRPLGIRAHRGTIRHLIDIWWNQKTTNEIHKMIIRIVPLFICWEIWKQNC